MNGKFRCRTAALILLFMTVGFFSFSVPAEAGADSPGIGRVLDDKMTGQDSSLTDTDPSTLEITPDRTSYTIIQGNPCNISGTITSNYTITRVTGTFDETDRYADFNPDSNTVDIADYSSGRLNSFEGARLSAGTHQLVITAEDASGKTDSETITIVVHPNSYTVSYDANGGTGAPESQTKQHGVDLTLSSIVPARSGYTFKGWAPTAAGSPVYQPGGTYRANASVTLYAIWELGSVTYTIAYNANGGTGAPETQSKTENVSVVLSSDVPARTDYIFKGWATTPTGSPVYQPGDTYNENASVTLYAVWQEDTSLAIDAEHFPDDAFRQRVLTDADLNHNGHLSDDEILSVTDWQIGDNDISSLQGIGYFTALKKLVCNSNQLTTLDLSENTALKELECRNNQLTTLDVSRNTALTSLDCRNNQLTTLDVSHNTALKTLSCSNNQLTALDLTRNTALENLICYGNSIPALDIDIIEFLLDIYMNGTRKDRATSYEYVLTLYLDENGNVLREKPSQGSFTSLDYVLWFDKSAAVSIEGWKKTDEGWMYRMDDGSFAVNMWLKIKNRWYHFDADGYMQTGLQKIGDKWYYLSTTGAMQTGWQKIGNNWHYFNPTGEMQTGWRKIDEKYYYFDTLGAMQTGWQKIDGKWYYLNTTGAMQTGWRKSDESDY